ncbi:hypothetical protein [Nonomuraea longispora]|uniref:hypothetical protein n=1 Tax=Nonomuraea longispora TaxID=1848320 RepID=UPI00319E218D
MQESLWFYEAQQSGELRGWNRVSWPGASATFGFVASGTPATPDPISCTPA